MRAITTTVGPLAAAAASSIALSQSLSAAGPLILNGTLASGGVATLDKPRRITITSAGNDTGSTWTVVGTNWAGNIITETIAGSNILVTSVLDYLTVTSISLSAASASTVTAGTSGTADSPWVRFDEWADAAAALQFTVTGTVNYTFQYTWDDPNDPVNSVAPASMTWDSSISPVVGATASTSAALSVSPLWGRILLNSGTGSVKGVFTQYLQVPTT